MVRIRLRREGKKGQPSYRIVAAEKEAPRDGRFLEILGHYNPRTNPSTISIKEDRVYDWISRGAQPSDSVWQVFRLSGTDERIKRFKAGEDVESLLAEAKAADAGAVVDPRTHRLTAAEKPAQKSKAAAAAKTAEVEMAVETAEEAEPEAVVAEMETEPEPEMETEVEELPEAEAEDEEVEPEEEEEKEEE
jgi:small subunit ribosomal protein S16